MTTSGEGRALEMTTHVVYEWPQIAASVWEEGVREGKGRTLDLHTSSDSLWKDFPMSTTPTKWCENGKLNGDKHHQ